MPLPQGVWLSSKFTASELSNAAISGNTADPDKDGINNLLEYAYGMEPKISSTVGVPVSEIQNVGGADYLTITYRRNRAATDVIYGVQVSSDLQTWTTHVTELSVTDNGDGTDKVVVRDNIPVSSATNRFIRVQVTQ